MNNKVLNILFVFSISAIFIVSCGVNKDLKKVEKKINDKELREKLLSLNEKQFDFFYAKLNVDYKDKALNQSFKTSLKMTVDTVFSGTISYASFIIANFLANADSINVAYKQKKCYFTEDFSYISSILGVELEYNFIEKMLLGSPIGVNSTIKYKQIKDKNKQYYILSSHRKRVYKKIEKEKMNLENEKNDDIFIKYYFSSDSLVLKKTVFEVPVDSVSITINYVESILENNFLVPEYTTLIIKHPKDSINIGLSYGKQIVNKPKKQFFSVPSHYENCNK